MGKKIPGKKHRGIKDPEKQQEIRYNRIKNKINVPSSNPDHQDIPKSLQTLIDYKTQSKSNDNTTIKRKRKQPKTNLITISKNNENEYNQRADETKRSYLKRVHDMVSITLKEAQYESKYNVNILRNNETGEIQSIVKKPKITVNKMFKDTLVQQGKITKVVDRKKLTKSQKRKRKLEEKEKNKLDVEEGKDFDSFQDTVKFGDIVHAPPILVTPKKGQTTSRPGQKDLLLKSVLSANEKKSNTIQHTIPATENIKKTVFQKVENEKINKSGKRKDLPNALRRQLEKQQTEVVKAYRTMKAKRNNT